MVDHDISSSIMIFRKNTMHGFHFYDFMDSTLQSFWNLVDFDVIEWRWHHIGMTLRYFSDHFDIMFASLCLTCWTTLTSCVDHFDTTSGSRWLLVCFLYHPKQMAGHVIPSETPGIPGKPGIPGIPGIINVFSPLMQKAYEFLVFLVLEIWGLGLDDLGFSRGSTLTLVIPPNMSSNIILVEFPGFSNDYL